MRIIIILLNWNTFSFTLSGAEIKINTACYSVNFTTVPCEHDDLRRGREPMGREGREGREGEYHDGQNVQHGLHLGI